MNCPICHTYNKNAANFCNECGIDLKTHKHVNSTAGNGLKPYTPEFRTDNLPASQFSFKGERKLVTVLFTEISNYSYLIEKLSPEDVHQLMDGFFHILLTEIHKYQGTINQFTGNGIIAMFGAPSAIENHARNACLAALAAQGAVKNYAKTINRKLGISFKIRIGLNSGPVVVGSIGDDLRYDYTAFGDTTYLAFMIQNAAKPGSVLLSHSTYKKVCNYFNSNSLEPFSYKDKSAPIKIYELKQNVPVFQSLTKRRISSVLVGRDKELNKLKLHISKVISGEGSIINLVGEPGVGKSRLISELKKQDVAKKVALLEGRAVAFGKNLSFHPIINLFKNWAKISENDPPVESVKKLETSIWGVCLHQTSEIFPFVATLMGLRLSGEPLEKINAIEGEALEKLIINSVRNLLIKSAQTSPLIIILEDMHWADTSTIEFVESLLPLVKTNRILFINIFRPGYVGTGEHFIKTANKFYPENHAQISLWPLNKNYCEKLVANLINMKALPFSIREQILDRANGNPFFTEEIILSIIDSEAAVQKNVVFETASKIDALAIPHTIRDALMSRIDRLDEKTKNLITIASVIGRSFFYRILIDIIHPTEPIDKQLLFLEEAQLVFERNRMGEREYLFKHALTQEVVYESILYKKRIYLHLQVAASIEHLFNDKLYEFYGVLAYHYGKGENLGKAEEYLIKAGEESLKSSASNEALNCFKEALNLYLKKYTDKADPEKIAMLENNIGLAYYNKGLFIDALEHFDRVLERFGHGSPKSTFYKMFRLVCDISILTAKLYLPLKQSKRKPTERDNFIFDVFQKRGISLIYLDTERFFFENISFIRKMTHFDIKQINTGVYSFCSSSGIFSLTGLSFNISNRILKSSKKLIGQDDIKELLCYEFYKFFHSEMSGNWFECGGYDEKLVTLNLKQGRAWLAATYILLQGLLKIEQGFFSQAEKLAEKLNEIWEVYEYQNAKGLRYFLMITLLLKRRNFKSAKIVLEEGISFQKEIGEELGHLHYLGLKAIIQILQKDHNGAKYSLEHAKEIATRKGRVIPFYKSSYTMSLLLFDLNLLEKFILSKGYSNISKYKERAFDSANKALKTAKKYAPDKVEALKLMGTFFWLIKNQKKALKYWAQSISEAKKMGSSLELSRTYFEVGKRLFERKSNFRELNKIKRKDYLLKARAAFKGMDLQQDLKDLEGFADLSDIEL
ncbi:MAG: AAA family ATPase [Thermodesulfobacteriota bacterium]|nr:AAA family ATPase [Thermodesulfobacteriota bacterium]